MALLGEDFFSLYPSASPIVFPIAQCIRNRSQEVGKLPSA